MRRGLPPVVIVTTALFALPPDVAQATTGAQLRESCSAFGAGKPGAEISEIARMSECVAYINGVLDVPLLYEFKNGDDYCVPDGTTRGQTFNVARAAVLRPEVAKMTWPGSGPQVIYNAMRAKWPCSKTRP